MPPWTVFTSAAHRSFLWDLARARLALVGLLPDDRRRLVERFFAEWEKVDWDRLRFSIIHNDANDYNILVRGSTPSEHRVSAILDYGDVVHSATVCNLAVALAYVMLDKPDGSASVSLAAGGTPAYPADPIAAAAQVVTAYHETYPLTEAEVDSLYTLAVTRLCFSVCIAARQTRDVPDNEYLNISNAPAWSLLAAAKHSVRLAGASLSLCVRNARGESTDSKTASRRQRC
jgi:Ser/Thr protein kinase RdoA (MazF antagonist)